ncbi:NAD(P)-binding protein [Annulohypoxylon moriforme]|nr:NAD(P)-binding protein [Annulohypoxylon moriforme]
MAASKGTIILTGANGSLGSAIASKIVSTPEFAAYHGIYTVRDTASTPALKHALRTPQAAHLHNHDVMSLDLTDLTSVREIAATINAGVRAADIPPIRVLILNAGWQEFTTQTWTKDGFDVAFMANYLGHWLLTMLLLQSMDRESGKVVVIGSLAHDTTRDDPSWCAGFRRYAASKICELMMIGELQWRIDTDPSLNKVSVIGVDPGTMPTNLIRRGPWAMRMVLFKIMHLFASLTVWLAPNGPLRTTRKSAGDILAASFDPNPNKGLYFDGSERAEMSTEARDPAKQSLLWRDTLKYTQLKPGESALTNWE